MRLDAPVLIAGLDHSGKTPLRIALDRHPALAMARRIDLWTDVRVRHTRARTPLQHRAVLDALTVGRAASAGLDRRALSGALDGPFRALAVEIGRQLCARSGAVRWGLQEAMLEWHADAVLRDFPSARIIQLIRDPRDRAAAMSVAGAIGRGGLPGETAAWMASVEVGNAQAAANPGRFLVVRYEDLLSEPGPTLRRIGDFIGEDLHELPVDGLAPVVRRVDGLAPGQVALVERWAGDIMTQEGYRLSAPRAATAGPGAAERLRWRAGRMAWWWRSRRLPSVQGGT